jgi:hypothetical protein
MPRAPMTISAQFSRCRDPGDDLAGPPYLDPLGDRNPLQSEAGPG